MAITELKNVGHSLALAIQELWSKAARVLRCFFETFSISRAPFSVNNNHSLEVLNLFDQYISQFSYLYEPRSLY